MANQQLAIIPATTSAVTGSPLPTNMYDGITVTADNLAGSETVGIFVVAGTTLLPVVALDGTTAVTLTTTLNGVSLMGGPSYVFVKSATAGSCGVYVDFKLK